MSVCDSSDTLELAHIAITGIEAICCLSFGYLLWERQVFGKATMLSLAVFMITDVWFVLSFQYSMGCFENSEWRLIPVISHIWLNVSAMLPFISTFQIISYQSQTVKSLYQRIIGFAALMSIVCVLVMLSLKDDQNRQTYLLTAMLCEFPLFLSTVYFAKFAFHQLELTVARSILGHQTIFHPNPLNHDEILDIMGTLWTYRWCLLVLSSGVHFALILTFYAHKGFHRNGASMILIRVMYLVYLGLLLWLLFHDSLNRILDEIQNPIDHNSHANGFHPGLNLPQYPVPNRVSENKPLKSFALADPPIRKENQKSEVGEPMDEDRDTDLESAAGMAMIENSPMSQPRSDSQIEA